MGDKLSPFLLIPNKVIKEDDIRDLIASFIEGTDKFIVEVKVNPGNKIKVQVDALGGMGIDDCVEISRLIEGNYDREVEDFELEVSSAGLDSPFQVYEQYQKYQGKEVKVMTEDGKSYTGILGDVSNEGVSLSYEEKQRIEGRKKKELVQVKKEFLFDSADKENKIRATKIVISFK